MKRQGDEYEVIISGSELGGLIAGTWLSKNYNVLLLEENRYRSSFVKEGFVILNSASTAFQTSCVRKKGY